MRLRLTLWLELGKSAITATVVSLLGIGRYKPLEGSHPAIGEVGKFEEVEEERIECVCERAKAKEVIEAIRKVHPYEEVAFNIYPLISEEEL